MTERAEKILSGYIVAREVGGVNREMEKNLDSVKKKCYLVGRKLRKRCK